MNGSLSNMPRRLIVTLSPLVAIYALPSIAQPGGCGRVAHLSVRFGGSAAPRHCNDWRLGTATLDFGSRSRRSVYQSTSPIHWLMSYKCAPRGPVAEKLSGQSRECSGCVFSPCMYEAYRLDPACLLQKKSGGGGPLRRFKSSTREILGYGQKTCRGRALCSGPNVVTQSRGRRCALVGRTQCC